MNKKPLYLIVSLDDSLRQDVQSLIHESWSGPMIAVNGKLWNTQTMPGFVAIDDANAVVGYLCYVFHSSACEIMVLESLRENLGIGTALIEQVKAAAMKAGKQKIAVMTTNDNIHAIRFYQKRGFTLREMRINMLETSRKLKPGIPLLGDDDIPLRDEIEFELRL